MAIPEDIIDLWSEFPMQLKTEPLDDLFDIEPKPRLTKKLFESPTSIVNYNASKTSGVVTESLPDLSSEQFVNSLEFRGPDSGIVGETMKTSKLYAFEDFHSFLAREGGIDPERLSRLVDNVPPRPDEDFVSFLARTNGIKDEQMIIKLRQALKLEPVIEYKAEKLKMSRVPVKMEQDLKVGEGEDAASFFVRAGSWESSSSISEELASVGLDEFVDEDAESFFRRTETLSDNEFESEDADESQFSSPASVTLISTDQDIRGVNDQVLVQTSRSTAQEVYVHKEQRLVPVSGRSESTPMEDHVVPKKRKSTDEE